MKLKRAIDAALAFANEAQEGAALSPPDFLEYGLKEVDPLSMFSGQNFRLSRRK